MLVVMRPGSPGAAIEAVRALASEHGLAAEAFAANGQAVISLGGAIGHDLRASLATLPGVEAVVGESDPDAPRTRDLRITGIRPLLPPTILLDEMPLPGASAALISRARGAVTDILDGRDDRLVVVVGPCSIHDPVAALDYARRLRGLADELADDLFVVMRVYFEKPRTTIGWKGLINDPHLDGSFTINAGLRAARRLLIDLAALGLPAGCEFLDPILPQFFADAVSWGAIGARTTESQVHRELASGLSMPVGFKNGTGGGLQMAIDAVRAAAYPHHFLGVTEQGLAGIVGTTGNRDCHVILRGGRPGPNYDAANVAKTLDNLRGAGLAPRLMIDTSHDNSGKDFSRQPVVAGAVVEQVAGGQDGIIGVLMESFLVEGRQDLKDRASLVYGQSVTDSCMGWETTVGVLRELAGAVRQRRARRAA
jgi:3-deoxy-7-phosphoheptulonate synthase